MLPIHAVADQPPLPIGWEREAGLVQIGDASGGAVAWIAPHYGANCIGYAVRRPHGWMQILHVENPQALRERPTRSGCAVLFPFPGHVRGAHYRWAGVDYDLAPTVWGQTQYVHGFARTEPWQVAQYRVNDVHLTFSTGEVSSQIAAAYPFSVQLCLRIRLVGGMLVMTLDATNKSNQDAPVGLGLHPYIAPDLFGGDRTMVQVDLPGTMDHLLAEFIPTGERRSVTASLITPPAEGEMMLVARTNIAQRSMTTLRSAVNSACITLTATGCRDLVFYAPNDRPSIAIEPHSCAPGAASQTEHHPDGLMSLAPGATSRITMTLKVEDT